MDKNKIIEAAAKLVAKGAYDKAIKEYQKILDVDPKDVRILQKMGELYQKKNDNVQAAGYFTKVAESYTTDGFFLKAVALYKQVLKLDPNLVEVNIRLAELHQQLQLLGEAMAYFQLVANHYDKAGDTKRSLDVLRKMVDLDPDNVPSRIKLADLYVREKLNEEAISEFKKAAEHLKRQNRTDDYLRVAERLSALEPENFPLARELAELYLQRSDQKRALAKLQVCFKADPRDVETLKLLAVAFQGLGQTAKTVSVYKELAKAYEERGQNRDAEQTWSQVAQLDPNDPDVVARTAAHAPPPVTQPPPAPVATNQAPAHQPAKSATGQAPAYQPAAAQPAPQAPAAKPKGDPGIGKLLTETDVYVKYGLHDKALEHLRKIFSIDPENIDAHEKAYQIYQASNNQAQAAEQLLNVLRLHTMSGDAQRAQPFLQTMLQTNPTHPEVPVFLQALRLGPGGAAAAAQPQQAQAEVPEDAILVDSTEDDVIVADEPQEEVVSAEALAEAEPAELVAGDADEGVVLAPDDAEAAGRYDLDPPPVADGDPASAQIVSDFDAERPDLEQSDIQTGEHEVPSDLDEPRTDMSAIEAAGMDTPEPSHAFAPEIGDPEQHESPTRVTKALDPSLLRSAVSAPEPADDPFASSVEEPVEPPPEDEQSLAEAGNVDTGPGAADEMSFAGVAEDDERAIGDVPTGEVEAFAAAALQAPPPAEEAPPAEDAPPEEEPAGEECDEATFFIEQGLFEEAQEILETVTIAYPDHQRAAQLMAQLEAARAAAEGGGSGGGEAAAAAEGAGGKSAFDLAQELADELGGFGGGGEEAAPQASGDDYQVSVDEVFSEFKKGLEKVVKPEDVETHYDLGIAYKEMGLIDDAIGEFTVARKGCLGKRKECDCLTMMGLLQLMKGDPASAVDSFKQGLQSEHAKDELEKALRFELASAYEAASEPGKALFQYQKVQALDPSFREVAGHVERLAATATPEDDGSGSPPAPTSPSPASPAAKKKPGGGGGTGQQPALGSRKVGYV